MKIVMNIDESEFRMPIYPMQGNYNSNIPELQLYVCLFQFLQNILHDSCPYVEYFACLDGFMSSVVPLVDSDTTALGDFSIGIIVLHKTPL